MLAATREAKVDVDNAAQFIACPNATGDSNAPQPFRVEALSDGDNRIAAGRRALYLQWIGGVEPYSITLLDSRHRVLARLENLRDTCSATLPKTTLLPGRVFLTLEDGNGALIGSYPVAVHTLIPQPPAMLLKAGLRPESQALYRASLLSLQDGGAWQWEAMQIVQQLNCHAPGVQDWLSQYGEPSRC